MASTQSPTCMPSELPSLGGRQGMIHINLDDRQIGFLVRADHFGVVQHARRIVLQFDANAVGFLDHVAVGHDIALADPR